ncbi:MAG: EamA family transporter [Clostridia bacterium]|nr:EamA family transporter [Clostridia bacterium]
MENNNTKMATASINLAVSMLIFGTIGVVVRYCDLPSGFVAMVRGFVGALVLILVTMIIKKRPDKEGIKENLVLLLLSGACIGVNWILLFESYRYTTVATATLCYYMAPVFAVIASPIFLRARVGVGGWLCVSAAFLGMIMVSEPWSISPASNDAVGILLALGAAALYASVTIINKKMKEISSYDTTIAQLFVAAVTVMVYTLVAEKVTPDMLGAKEIILLLVVGVIHTGVAYTLFFGSVKSLPTEAVAVMSYIDPIVAVLLSALLLGEPMSVFGVIGAVLIIAATLIYELLPIITKKLKLTRGD